MGSHHGAALVPGSADELKLFYPQVAIDPAMVVDFPASHHQLSPMDGPERRRNAEAAAAYCLAQPRWRPAIQAHKSWGLP